MTEMAPRVRRVEAWLLTSALFVIGTAIVVAGAREWFPPLASEHGAGIDRMMFYLLATTGSLVLIGHAALGYFVFRFSRKREETYVPPSTNAQRVWSILPAFVVALVAEGGVLVLGLPVWTQLYGSTAPPDAVVVEVTAEQFAWNVRYPGRDGVFGRTAPQLISVENPLGRDPKDPSSSDVTLHDSYFVVGHFHLMIGGVTLLAIFAGTYFWFPKMFGRMMSETLGKIHFWTTFVPFYAVFVAMHFFGLAGAPRRYYAFSSFEFLRGYEDLSLFISVSAFVLGAGQVVFAFNFLWSLFKGAKAPRNPWAAATLEWSAPSPPPHGNWEERVPQVYRGPYDYGISGTGTDYASQGRAETGRI